MNPPNLMDQTTIPIELAGTSYKIGLHELNKGFERFCKKHGINPEEEKRSIPISTPSDRSSHEKAVRYGRSYRRD